MRRYPYVYVDADGSARELHESERAYLETEFAGGDGNMPSIKSRYDERNGWDKLNGYLERALLPAGLGVGPAPAQDPLRPLSRADEIARLRAWGVDVVENADGSLTIRAKPPV
jgi:hypothetical protein